MGPPGRLIDIGGRRLHAMVEGRGAPTVVIESGGGGGASVQDIPVQRLIAEFTRCVCYDRAGLGWSDPDPGPRTLEAMADDLEALLRAIGEIAAVVVVAGSFGGLVARAFALRHPERVAGMVLVDAAEERKYFATMPAFRQTLESELRTAEIRAAAGALSTEVGPTVRASRHLDAGALRAMLEVLDKPSHFRGSRDELQILDHISAEDRMAGGLGRLGDLPLIVLRHTRPYEGPYAAWEDGWEAAQRRLAALSTRSALIAAEGCGHSISVENPRLVAACAAAVVDHARGGRFDVAEAEAFAAAPP